MRPIVEATFFDDALITPDFGLGTVLLYDAYIDVRPTSWFKEGQAGAVEVAARYEGFNHPRVRSRWWRCARRVRLANRSAARHRPEEFFGVLVRAAFFNTPLLLGPTYAERWVLRRVTTK